LEFDDGLGWNLDLLLRLRIEAGASLPFCFTSLPNPGDTRTNIDGTDGAGGIIGTIMFGIDA
jgi:hypothetical protein